VVGFLQCLDNRDYLKNNNLESKYEFKNNFVKINNHVFNFIKIDENYFENDRVVNLRGRNDHYPNFIDARGNQINVFREYVKAFYNFIENKSIGECFLCSSPVYIDKNRIILTNQNDEENINRFFNKIESLNMVHNKLLGPSDKFPNAYWNIKNKFKICHLCSFLLIHHHLAFTKLSDNSQIFINATSFKIMYEMNNLVNEIYGKGEASRRQIREILAMSIIEYSRKLNVSLGLWEQMNLEIIIKNSYGIDSFSLPTQIVNLIADRQIASLLSDIGEFSILNTVLNGEFDKLLNFTYKFIKIGLKQNNERNKNDNKYISSYLYKGKNKSNLINISQKILKLYTIINERRKIYG
jgi:CRISPR-associated protein Cst1